MSAFYDLASVVLVPSGYKSGKIYAQKPLTTDGQLTFTRASTATRVNASGLIEEVASGVPRLDYLNSTCPRLILEPQRSNLCLWSENFDNAFWSKTRCVATANTTISPDGYVSADTLTATELAESYVQITATPTTSQVAFSFFAKKNNVNFVHSLAWDNSANGARQWFDIENGTVGSSTVFGTGYSVASASIVDYGNGWYRCITIYNVTSGILNGFRVSLSTVNAGIDSAIGSAQYFWGAQIESAAYASSYIPTLSTSVTRVAEIASSASVPSLFGATEGAFFIELTHDGTNTNGAMPLFLRSSVTGSFNQATYIQFGINSVTLSVYSATVLQASITASGYTNGQTLKIAFAYKANDFVLYVNGVQRGTDSSGAISNSLSFVDFGYTLNQSTFQYNGKISQALLFKTRLTNAQLAELSTL